MNSPFEYPNIKPAGDKMWYLYNDENYLVGAIWINSFSNAIQSYVASSDESVQTHPSFEAAYIALKMRIK